MKHIISFLLIILLPLICCAQLFEEGCIMFDSKKRINVIQTDPTLITDQSWFNDLVSAYGIELLKYIGEDVIPENMIDNYLYYYISFNKLYSVQEVLSSFNASDNIILAEGCPIVQLCNGANTNDTYHSNMWNLDIIGMNQVWAQQLEYGNEEILVAVIDTGIDLGTDDDETLHEDLDGNIWIGLAGNYGYDMTGLLGNEINYDMLYHPRDRVGHGTFISGIISGINNNNQGIASVAGGWIYSDNSRHYGCKILPIRKTASVTVLQGFLRAYHHRSNIINYSSESWSESQIFHNIISLITNDELNLGVAPLIIAAASNLGGETELTWPAAWPEVLAVTGTDEFDSVGNYATYGTFVDISAPGGASSNQYHESGVFSTLPMNPNFSFFPNGNPEYDYWWGTSFAAPQVAGVAALIASHYPNLSGNEIRGRLLGTADYHYENQQHLLGKLGAGRLNAYRALTEDPHPSLVINKLTTNSTPNCNLLLDHRNELTINLKNWWIPTTDVWGYISTSDPGVHISYAPNPFNMTSWGDIGSEQTANNNLTIYLDVDPGVTRIVEFVLHIVADNIPPYVETNFSLQVHPDIASGSINLNLGVSEFINPIIASKDINHDGFDESVVSTNLGHVYVINNSPNPIQIDAHANMICSPAIGDVNSDMEYEIVAGNSLGELYVWNYQGQTVTPQPFILPGQISKVVLEDVNGDGQIDIIASLQTTSSITNSMEGIAIINMVNGSIYTYNVNLRLKGEMAVTDLNNDSSREIVCLAEGVYLNGQLQNRSALKLIVFEISQNFAINMHSIAEFGSPGAPHSVLSGPVIADLNENGSRDIIFTHCISGTGNQGDNGDFRTSDCYIEVYTNVLSNTSHWSHEYTDYTSIEHQLVVGDFNAQPGLEILVDFGQFIVCNEINAQLGLSVLHNSSSSSTNVLVLDVNGDGEIEFIQTLDNTIRVFNSQLEILPEWGLIVPNGNPFRGLSFIKKHNDEYSLVLSDNVGNIYFLPVEYTVTSPFIYTQHQYNSRRTGYYTQPIPEIVLHDIELKHDIYLERDVVFDAQITNISCISIVADPCKRIVINGNMELIGSETNAIELTGTCINPTIAYWNGVCFMNNSRSILSFINLHNAKTGITYIDYGEHSLIKSTISDNLHGIDIYNNSPILYNNMIHNNIDFGICVDHFSSPYMGQECSTRAGRNAIYDNEVGMIVNLSSPLLKEGHNDINNTTWNIYTHECHPFSAQKNWWGSSEPSEFVPKFNDPEVIAFDPWDMSPNIIIDLPPEQIFELALNYLYNGEFSMAIPLFHLILADSLEMEEDFISVNSLLICYEKTENLAAYEVFIIQQLSGSLSEKMRKCYEECLTLIKRLFQNYNYAIAYYESILDNNPTLTDSCYAVIDIGNTYLESNSKASGRYVQFKPKSITEHLAKMQILLEQLQANSDTSGDHVPSLSPVLHQNFPNPFNPSTTISFFIPKVSKVELTIYNLKGQKVKSLVNSTLTKGNHKIVWDGMNLTNKPVASGIYFYKLNYGSQSIVKKCIMLK